MRHRTHFRIRMRKLLSGFLAVSTAITMLGASAATLLAEEPSTEYALAGAGTGEDITIHFGDDEDKAINVHVNPESDTGLEALGDETESETEAKNTGLEKVEAGGFVTISPADESLLPEEAEASAEILTGKAVNTAVEKVEEAVSTETTSETGAPVGNSAQDGEKEAPAGVKSAPEEDATLETDEKTEYRVFEISLENVDEEQYQEGFKVEVSLPEDVRGRNFRLFHIHEGQEPVEIPIETVGTVDHKTGLEVVSGFEFQTDGFSEFVLQYTVDFHYEINGKLYEFSIPGGGFVSLEHLVEVLEIASDDASTAHETENVKNGTENGNDFFGEVSSSAETGENAEGSKKNTAGTDNSSSTGSTAYEEAIKLNEVEVSEATKKFVADVESVEFSSPELVWVGKVNEAATVGGLKEANGLIIEYSANLTEEQIAEIDAQTVEAGDWALISLKPFYTEEKLTVTMKNGDVFEIKVTDAQEDPLGLDGKAFAIVNTKNNISTAMKPVISNNRLQGDTVTLSQNGSTPTCSDNASYWVFEYVGDGKYYIKSGDLYLKITGTNAADGKIELVSRDEAAPITITQPENNKYRFCNDNGLSINNWDGTFWYGIWNNVDERMMLRTPYDPGKPAVRETVDSRALGLTINLFDYGPDDGDKNLDHVDNALGGDNVSNYWNEGINQYSDLKFFSYGTGYGDGTCGINNFTGTKPDHKAAQGIVQNTLESGYPSLQNGQSLAYLFDGSSRDGKTVYSNVNRLFWNEDGKLAYNSDESYAFYNKGTKDFKIYNQTYNEEGSTDTEPFNIGFFPFNDYDQRYQCIHGDNFNWGCTGSNKTHGVDDEVGHFNHHFGLSMSGTFNIVRNQDMTFNFSGDDDLWVFVDDVLVLDIGGIHNPISGSIDFGTADGSVTVSPKVVAIDGDSNYLAPSTIEEAFEKAGRIWDGRDYSSHEIKVFYLERGGMYSNLSMEINLPLIPSGILSFNKKDNENAAVKGAVFKLYTDENCTQPLSFKSEECVAIADDNGVVTFDGVPVFEEGYYYLKEFSAPVGYELDPTAYPVTIKDKNYPEQGASFIHGADGNPVTEIIDPQKKITVSLEKKWEGGVPEGASATFALKRRRSYEGDIAPKSCNLEIYRYKEGDSKPIYAKTVTYAGGTDVTVNWEYASHYRGGYYTNIMHYREDSLNGEMKSKSSAEAAITIRLNDSGTKKLYIRDENVNSGWSEGVRNIVTEGTPVPSSSEHVSVSDQEDPDFSIEKTLNASTGWTWTFDPQDVESLNEYGLVETYAYYIKEVRHSPSNWVVSYSSNALTADGTIIATNYKNEVYVEKRWYDHKGNLFESQPTDLVSVTLQSTNGGQISDDKTKNITAQARGVWTVENNGDRVYEATENSVPLGYEVSYSFLDIADSVERNTDGVHRGGTIYINNRQKVGSLQITKTIQKNGSIDGSAKGTFYYAVYDSQYNPNANPVQSPVRTGKIVVTKNGSKTVTETELIYGTYYVYELTGEDGTPIISGNSGTHNKIDNTIYNVTGSGTSAIVGDTAGSVYLTNNKETVNKEATKTWDSEELEHPTIYFKLFYNDGDNATEVIGAGPKELKNDTTKVTWNDLPKYDEDGNEYLYLVKEFIKDGENLVEAAPYGYVKAESGLSVTNTQSKTQIGVLKVDKTDSTPLTGAKFILKRYSADNYQGVVKTWPEQEVSAEESTKGTLSFSDLIVGYYELEESESPAGYIKTGENPRFEVAADAQGALHVNFTNSDMVTYKNGVFTVSNSPGVALPATGGPGTRLFTILGSILVLGAGILLWRRRRIV